MEPILITAAGTLSPGPGACCPHDLAAGSLLAPPEDDRRLWRLTEGALRLDRLADEAGAESAGGTFIQLLLPVIVGGAGIFGLVKASSGGIHLERAAYVYAVLAVIATVAAYRWMDNLGTAQSKPREQLQIVREPHTWIMAVLYIGTFGSFIGYSAAMPLLIKLNFWVPGMKQECQNE